MKEIKSYTLDEETIKIIENEAIKMFSSNSYAITNLIRKGVKSKETEIKLRTLYGIMKDSMKAVVNTPIVRNTIIEIEKYIEDLE